MIIIINLIYGSYRQICDGTHEYALNIILIGQFPFLKVINEAYARPYGVSRTLIIHSHKLIKQPIYQ